MIIAKLKQYGNGLAKVGYSFVNPNGPSSKADRGESVNLIDNAKRSAARARARVKDYVLMARLDYLLTLTYRGPQPDLDQAWADFKAFVREYRIKNPEWQYVVAYERHKSGGIHFHLAVRGWQNVLELRKCWRSVVGEGNIDVRSPDEKGRYRWGRLKLAHYIAKYIGKNLESALLNRRKYAASRNIEQPETSRHEIPEGADLEWHLERILTRAGCRAMHHYQSPDHCSGVMFSWDCREAGT